MRCAEHDVPAETCGRCAQRTALGEALPLFVGVGYLATLALGTLLFHGHPVIGGMAAVVAIVLGRTLQSVVRRHTTR